MGGIDFVHGGTLIPDREIVDLPIPTDVVSRVSRDLHEFAQQPAARFDFLTHHVIHETAREIDEPAAGHVMVPHERVLRTVPISGMETLDELLRA